VENNKTACANPRHTLQPEGVSGADRKPVRALQPLASAENGILMCTLLRKNIMVLYIIPNEITISLRDIKKKQELSS